MQSLTKEELYDLARNLLTKDNREESLEPYVLLYEKDPENLEARFFSYYWAYKGFFDERDYTNTPKMLVKIIDSAAEAIRYIKLGEEDEDEKKFVAREIVDIYLSVVGFFVNRGEYVVAGIRGLYDLGDVIEAEFTGDCEYMKLVTELWKKAVGFHNERWQSPIQKKMEDYVEKIQKADPSYVPPKAPLDKKMSDGVEKGLKKSFGALKKLMNNIDSKIK